MKHLKKITDEETFGINGELVSPSEMTQDEQNRIKQKILSSAPQKRENKRPKRQRKLAVITAALCVFTMVAVSAEAFGWDISLSKLFGATDEEIEYAENTGLYNTYENIKSNEIDGVSIELKQSIADNRMCYLVFDVILPNEKPYLSDNDVGKNDFSVGNPGDLIFSHIIPITTYEKYGDGRLSLAVFLSFDEAIDYSKPLKIVFNDISYSTMYGPKTVDGTWKLSMNIEKSDKLKSADIDEKCAITGMESHYIDGNEFEHTPIDVPGKLTHYELTPLSLTLDFQSDVFSPENAQILCDASRMLEEDTMLKIKYKDGKTEAISCYDPVINQISSKYAEGAETFTSRYILNLSKIVDVDNVESLEFCGAEIELN